MKKKRRFFKRFLKSFLRVIESILILMAINEVKGLEGLHFYSSPVTTDHSKISAAILIFVRAAVI